MAKRKSEQLTMVGAVIYYIVVGSLAVTVFCALLESFK